MCNLYAERNSFCFCNLLGQVLLWNYAMGEFKKEEWQGWLCSCLYSYFKFPEIQAFA